MTRAVFSILPLALLLAGCLDDKDDTSDTQDDSGVLGVYTVSGTRIAPGDDFFDTTADGIPPFSYSRHLMELRNESDEAVTISSFDLTPTGGIFDHEWTLIDAESSSADPQPLDLSGTTLAAGEGVYFDLYFYPAASGERTEAASISYDGGTYDFTITGRGRDAWTLFSHGENSLERVHGDPAADTYAGTACGGPSDSMIYSGNVNEWSDGFSENLVVSRVDASGDLAWSMEWDEDYEQLSPDPGQNGETGGGSNSIDCDADYVYVTGRRSQSSYNSVFQTLVLKVDANTGAVVWAAAWSPADVDEPGYAWQSSMGYAVDATLSDRVIVAGQSLDSAEVSLIALSKADGSLLWSQHLDVVAGSNDRAHSLAVDSAGNAWIGGLTNGRGLVARVTGVDGSDPQLDFVKQLDMGTGSNVNGIDLDSAGNAYLSLDRRGATTQLSIARMDTDGSVAWAKTWDAGNASDQNNSHVVTVDGNAVYLGGRVAIATGDTQFGEGFLMRLGTDGSYEWGAAYYTGKGAEEVVEDRVKGIVPTSSGDLRILMHSWAVQQNYGHYWGYWYDLQDDPMADLTLDEDPGDGAALLEDYALSVSDVTSSAAFRPATGSYYTGDNVAAVRTLDTTGVWKPAPAAVEYEDTVGHEGGGVDGDNVVMFLDLY